MPHNHRDRCWRASVLLKCPGARNPKNSFDLIAQFDLPGLKKGSMTSGGMETKWKICLSDGNKFVREKWTRGLQARQIRTNYGIRPTAAKYLTVLLCGLLLYHTLGSGCTYLCKKKHRPYEKRRAIKESNRSQQFASSQ